MTTKKMSKEEFMAKVSESKKSKEEVNMTAKKIEVTKEKIEDKKEVKLEKIEVPVVKQEKQEVKKIEAPIVKQEAKKEDSVFEYDKATEIIKEQININQDLKIVETSISSGTSYFSGRTRLFKLIKSKKGISLEINVQLSKEFCKDIIGIEDISIAKAHSKHLGTMKHHYRSSDSKELSKIITSIMTTFKSTIKKEEVKEAKAV